VGGVAVVPVQNVSEGAETTALPQCSAALNFPSTQHAIAAAVDEGTRSAPDHILRRHDRNAARDVTSA
jgi:hypothetical protein